VNRRLRLALVAVVTLGLIVVGCGGGSDSTGARSADGLTTPHEATVPAASLPMVARAIVPKLGVYSAPEDSKPAQVLDNPWVVSEDYPDQTVPQVFLVKEQRADGWVQVLLPVRPNGSTGWVHATDVSVAPNPFHVTIELGAHRITVTELGNPIYQGDIAIGTDETPTPTGQYYVRVKIKAVDPDTVYGPYAWGLSSHSDVLETFNGGDGEIGIHGNNDASVLGQSVSHGCIRMDNAAVTDLAGKLPLGTPVDVTA
jgi:lipoprotein-anchoring transpeptidase ErfK/SrfK